MRLHDSAHARPRSNKPSRSPFFWASARFPCYAVRGLTGVQLLAWWLIVAGGLVKIPQLVDRGAGIPPAFFSARKESRWSRKETLGVAEVGNASSGTARLRAVPGAYLSTCGLGCTSGASAPPDPGVHRTQLGKNLSAEESVGRGQVSYWLPL